MTVPNITQQMIDEAAPPMTALKRVALVAGGAALWYTGALLWVAGGVVLVLSVATLLALAAPALWHRVAGHLMPKMMTQMENKHRHIRRELMASARGKVLSVGCGDAPCLKFVPQQHGVVTEYVALEPNVHMHPALNRTVARVAPPFPVRVTGAFVNELVSAEAGTFDFVILGNVLCEIPDHRAAIADVRRLLAPGGRVYFSEHVAAPRGSFTRRMQDAINPWWRTVSDGCNCNRETLQDISAELDVMHSVTVVAALPHVRQFELGIAQARAGDASSR
jgi:SAM-dependent methyltransferase